MLVMQIFGWVVVTLMVAAFILSMVVLMSSAVKYHPMKRK